MTKWIITRKQLPTEADGDKNGEVLAVVEEPPGTFRIRIERVKDIIRKPDKYSSWAIIPPIPQ